MPVSPPPPPPPLHTHTRTPFRHPPSLSHCVVIFSVGDAASSARIRLHREINGAQEKEIEREHTCILATWQGELVRASEREREDRWLTGWWWGEDSVWERERVGSGAKVHLSYTVYLKQRNSLFECLFVKCKFRASVEKSHPHRLGVTALSAA